MFIVDDCFRAGSGGGGDCKIAGGWFSGGGGGGGSFTSFLILSLIKFSMQSFVVRKFTLLFSGFVAAGLLAVDSPLSPPPIHMYKLFGND